MVFSSLTFLFIFLPLVLLLYAGAFILPKRLKLDDIAVRLGNLVLLLSSIFFYTWGEQLLVLVMLASTLVDYFCGLAIGAGGRPFGEPLSQLSADSKKSAAQRAAMITSISFNLGTLAIFKYFNFGVENAQSVLNLLGVQSEFLTSLPAIALPLGISFYTFQSMSYTIDVYRGNVKATRNLLDFACYVTLFPQLVAGPIVRYRDVERELRSRRITIDSFGRGVERFIIGLGKKVLIANTLAAPADMIFDLSPQMLSTPLAWLGIVCYALQIYFDFSGYSDMAIGLGLMLGFNFPENFNFPYFARSIKDFWRRWHISLSTWFRDYLYIPLGGSRVSPSRVYLNLWLVFVLCGLWHGASWTFVVWGIYHGAFLVLERAGLETWLQRRNFLLQHVYTVIVVLGGWVIFRAETIAQAVYYMSALAGFDTVGGAGIPLSFYLRSDVALAVCIGILFSMPLAPWIGKKLVVQTENAGFDAGAGLSTLSKPAHVFRFIGFSAILLWSIVLLSSGTYNPFIYFRF